ncbi:MAG: hypothetical protein IH811_09660 [Proteobacteria bacterium]|nr:hypothetical protein [Pseudomonadota bacterium]
MNPELKRAAELAGAYIESFDTEKVSEEPDPDALRAKLYKELTADGLPPLQVIEELADAFVAGLKWAFWMMGGLLVVGIALSALRGGRPKPDPAARPEPVAVSPASD